MHVILLLTAILVLLVSLRQMTWIEMSKSKSTIQEIKQFLFEEDPDYQKKYMSA